ncbi:E3 ubiquitin-protein ligase RNF220 [Trichoplax sp. H2]|nr:E3 ubiquitin-protein ligase RNF220 [Trichoplax sp. H2]|eukprot:RDD45599.1 E3 ubiquitin-protein ligase RNF220 [Trichoplax sp. H2]
MDGHQSNQQQPQKLQSSTAAEYGNNNKNIGTPPALMALASTADATRTSNSMALPHELPNVYSTSHNRDGIPTVYGYPPSNISSLTPHYAPLQAQLYDQYGELALHAMPVLPIHHTQLQPASAVGQTHLIASNNLHQNETTATARSTNAGQIGVQFDGSSGAFKPFTTTKDATTSDDRKANTEEKNKTDDRVSQAIPSEGNKNNNNAKKEEDSSAETNGVDNAGTSKDSLEVENNRDGRSRRKRKSTYGGNCPICGMTIRTSDLQSHLDMELKKMTAMFSSLSKSNSRRNLRESSHGRKSTQQASSKKQKENTESLSPSISRGSLYEVFESVRNNRLIRSKGESSSDGTSLTSNAMNRRLLNQGRYSGNTYLTASSSTTSTSTLCPICNQTITGSDTEMNDHVNNCLGNKGISNEGSSGHQSDKFIEYDWCGESRVRATALVEEDLTASGFEKIKKTDEDENVVIDIDVSEAFGKSQYTEADLIPCSADEAKEERSRKALRQAMLGIDKSSKAVESSKWTNCKSNDIDIKSQVVDGVGGDTEKGIKDRNSDKRTSDSSSSFNPSYRCLICMEPYYIPLTSINCWHVHCEECWMRTLGAKKLCPQCNVITSPADLRKIYL